VTAEGQDLRLDVLPKDGREEPRQVPTTGAIPAQRLETERPLLLPPPRLAAVPASALPRGAPLPVESLQHPLCCYDALLSDQLRQALEAPEVLT